MTRAVAPRGPTQPGRLREAFTGQGRLSRTVARFERHARLFIMFSCLLASAECTQVQESKIQSLVSRSTLSILSKRGSLSLRGTMAGWGNAALGRAVRDQGL